MDWYSQKSYCEDLPTVPVPEIGIVLVAGATGYVGGRLVPELIERGYRVRVMVRSFSADDAERWPEAEVVVADALDEQQLQGALRGVSVAYYLMHAMLKGDMDYAGSEFEAAHSFRVIAEEEGLQRIIYLGSLAETSRGLNENSRKGDSVSEILSRGKVPVTNLRAAMIIGSGSASFEILDRLVRHSPVFFIPPWAKKDCQTIGIRDVIKYLVGVLETRETIGHDYEIGGDDLLSYREMMKILVKLLRKRRLFLPSPFSSIRLYSYIISLISPVPAQIVAAVMTGVKNGTVVRDHSIRALIDFKTIRFKVAVLRAFSREEHDKIATRWSDAYPPAHELSMKLTELKQPPRFISTQSLLTDKEPPAVFNSICQIGGNQGWFNTNWMWRMRGRMDRILMGVGSVRGRRSAQSLRINDVIDFWRVEDMVENERLLLRAEMKLPGKGWLEFQIENMPPRNKIIVTAYFEPRGMAGKLYWYTFLPFHFYIFGDLLKQLSKKS